MKYALLYESAADVAERREDLRRPRHGQVEEPRASRVEPVGEQVVVGSQHGLRVVRVRSRHAGRQRSDDRSVPG